MHVVVSILQVVSCIYHGVVNNVAIHTKIGFQQILVKGMFTRIKMIADIIYA